MTVETAGVGTESIDVDDVAETYTTDPLGGDQLSTSVGGTNLGSREAISTDRLYASERSSPVHTLLHLLDDAASYAGSAERASKAGDAHEAADQLRHLKALLPKLLVHSQSGDGLKSLVIGLQEALDCDIESLDAHQVAVIRAVLAAMQHGPFVKFERAEDLKIELEDAGLEVDPEELTIIGGELDDFGAR